MSYPYTLIMFLFLIPAFFIIAFCWAIKNPNVIMKIRKQSISKALGAFLLFVFILYLSFAAGDIVVQKLTEILKEYFISAEEPLSEFLGIAILLSISLPISVTLEILCFKKIYRPNKTKYDSEYISKLMASESLRAPATTRQQLMQKITGGQATTCDIKRAKEMIDGNIRPIKCFLASREPSSDNTLIIDSRWGSGKTTAILISINESAKINNYYIYESVFKYQGNLDEFTKDILETLKNIMAKMNIYAKSLFRDLAVNLDSNIYKTFANFMANRDSSAMLTSEIVYQINKKYNDANLQERIVLVVDDIDRLLGHDILEILSLLSVLRRLKFVKIILPVDLTVINEALKNEKVVEPDRFIEKYLPEQQALKINSSYDIIKDIIEGKIRHTQKVFDRNRNFKPAFEAILMKLLSNILEKEISNLNDNQYDWLRSAIPENATRLAKTIISARHSFPTPNATPQETIYWGSVASPRSGRRFENIILCLQSSKRGRIAKSFSDEDYARYVLSWLTFYMKRNWDEIGIVMRSASDIFNESLADMDNLSENPAKQFVEVFNRLFPETPIDYVE